MFYELFRNTMTRLRRGLLAHFGYQIAFYITPRFYWPPHIYDAFILPILHFDEARYIDIIELYMQMIK